MKKILIYFAALVTLMACGNAGDDLGKTRTHSFSEVEKMFANPGKEFRPAPLWTWNARVTHEDIDRMLSDFKDQGFGGAFIHPRPGLETEYLSDEWFELWRYSVEKGKEIGLDIWIYDEDSYPSGFAGGHVQREMPESYDHPTSLEPVIADNLPDDMKDYVACLKREGDNFIDITGRTFSPREGMVKPLSWSEINERKSGHDYIFDGYGLFEPFEVSESSNCDY